MAKIRKQKIKDISPKYLTTPMREKVAIDPLAEPFGRRIGGLGGRLETTVVEAINKDGNLVKEVINDKLNTATKKILGDFTFGSSGAIKMITDVDNGLWISPTGILGKKAGATTFSIDTHGNAVFSGDLIGNNITGATITGATITGGTFQTAASGASIVLTEIGGFSHRIQFKDTLGEQRFLMWMHDDIMFRMETVGSIDVNFRSGKDMNIEAANNMTINAETGEIRLGDTRVTWLYPSLNNWGSLGRSDRKYRDIYRTNEFSCDLPTVENACNIFKRIKKPTKIIPKGRKHFGERQYFKIEDFPIEMKAENDKEKLDIEMTRVAGVTLQAVKEILDRLEKLEKNVIMK